MSSVLFFSGFHRFLDKAFSKRLVRFSGRNFLGRICVFHQGGGSFKYYRPVDFYRRINCFGRVIRLQTYFFRSSALATVLYLNGLVSSILAVQNLFLGNLIFSGFFLPKKEMSLAFSNGSAIPLNFVNLFTVISAAELGPGKGISLFRAAGTSAVLVKKTNFSGFIKCSSGWLLKLPLDSLVTLGRMSNQGHRHFRAPNAGYNRRRGIRPTVRGVVKNPCDHPHGGGEGKGSPPKAQKTPWSKLTKGTPTTKKKWAILRRRFFKNGSSVSS